MSDIAAIVDRLSWNQRWELRRFDRGPRYVGGGGDTLAKVTADALTRRGLIERHAGSRAQLTELGLAVAAEIERRSP